MLISADDAVTRLKAGNIVALPTETVYGLAGLALSEVSVQKIFDLKKRPATNPLIVHVWNLGMAEKLANFSDLAYRISSLFWPGPLTLVLPKKGVVPDLVTAGNDTVALRMPKHPVFCEILKKVDQPLAAPSANPANRTSPTMPEHLFDLFGDNCPPTVDGGKCLIGLESTVLDLSNRNPKILRYGPLSQKDIITKINGISISPPDPIPNVSKISSGDRAPGQGRVHYAPSTPLYLYPSLNRLLEEKLSGNDLILVYSDQDEKAVHARGWKTIKLSKNENAKEIAQSLYDTFSKADKSAMKRLHITLFPSNGSISDAINDRIRRAAHELVN